MDVSELIDRAEIHDVLVRYCTCVDSNDIDRLVEEVFAEDAVDDHGLGDWSGRERLRAGFRSVMSQFAGTTHVLGNVVIDVRGDRASSRSYVTAWHWLPSAGTSDAARAADFAVVGAYDDELRRTERGWRIAHRVFRPVGASVVAVGQLPAFLVPRRRGT